MQGRTPQKMIKPPNASRTSLAEPRWSGKAGLVLTSCNPTGVAMLVSPRRLRSQKDTHGDSAVNVAPCRPLAANAAQLCSAQEKEGTHRKHPKGNQSVPPAKGSSSMLTGSINTDEAADFCSRSWTPEISRTAALARPETPFSLSFSSRTSRSLEQDRVRSGQQRR